MLGTLDACTRLLNCLALLHEDTQEFLAENRYNYVEMN